MNLRIDDLTLDEQPAAFDMLRQVVHFVETPNELMSAEIGCVVNNDIPDLLGHRVSRNKVSLKKYDVCPQGKLFVLFRGEMKVITHKGVAIRGGSFTVVVPKSDLTKPIAFPDPILAKGFEF